MATYASPYETVAGRGVPAQLAEGDKPDRLTRLPQSTLGPVMSSVAPPLAPKPGPTTLPMQQMAGGMPGQALPATGVQAPAPAGAPAGTQGAAGGARPSVPPGFGGINFTPYGPGNTLRSQQITPNGLGGVGGQMSQEATRARQLASMDLEGLGGPDRGQIASDTLQRLIRDTEPQFQQELRGVGQKAAALGRLGSGMTTSDLGDVSQRRNQAITSEASRLASES